MVFVRYSSSSNFPLKIWIKRCFKTEEVARKFIEEIKHKDEADGIQREIQIASSDAIGLKEDEPHGKKRKTNH